MELAPLGKVTFPTQANAPTFAYANGPNCILGNGRMLIHGHNNYHDIAEVQIPDTLPGQATLIRWYDPTLGNLASYSAANKADGSATQGTWHRGVFHADGRLWGCVSPYYNVSNSWIASLWNATTSQFSGWGKPSINSMKSTGHCGVLPSRLQQAWGHDTWSCEIGVAGLAATNNGPALYTFNRSETIANQATFSVTPRFESPLGSPYPGWWGDREINGITFTPNELVLGYRKTFGARWYGTGAGSGRYQTEPGVPLHPIPSELHPGQIASDPCSSAQGMHAEQFVAFLLVASIDSILAGTPVWDEIDLRPLGVVSKWGRVDPKYDTATGRLYLTEYRADGDKPVVHVFQTEDSEMIQQLLDQIAVMQTQLDQLMADLTTLQADVAVKDAAIVTLTTERDAAVAAQAALNLAIDQAQGQA